MIKNFWNVFCLVDIIYKHKYMALFTKITVFAKYSLKLYGIWSIVNLLEICKTVYSRAMFSSTFSHRAVLYARWREADSWHGFYIGLHIPVDTFLLRRWLALTCLWLYPQTYPILWCAVLTVSIVGSSRAWLYSFLCAILIRSKNAVPVECCFIFLLPVFLYNVDASGTIGWFTQQFLPAAAA